MATLLLVHVEVTLARNWSANSVSLVDRRFCHSFGHGFN